MSDRNISTDEQVTIRGKLGSVTMHAEDWLSMHSYATSTRERDRRQFAAMAMQGLAGAYSDGGNFHEQHVAKGAVKLADALLAALESET